MKNPLPAKRHTGGCISGRTEAPGVSAINTFGVRRRPYPVTADTARYRAGRTGQDMSNPLSTAGDSGLRQVQDFPFLRLRSDRGPSPRPHL